MNIWHLQFSLAIRIIFNKYLDEKPFKETKFKSIISNAFNILSKKIGMVNKYYTSNYINIWEVRDSATIQ